MKKEEMEDLVKLASQFGGNFSIGQWGLCGECIY